MIIKILIFIIIGILVIGSVYTYYQQHEIEKWQRIATKNKPIEILIPDSSLWKKATLEVNKIKTDNDVLKKYLKENKEKIKSQTELILVLNGMLDSLSTTIGETTFVGTDTILTRNFNFSDSIRDLDGYFQVKLPYKIFFNRDSYKLKLIINLTENKQHLWSTIIENPNSKYLKIENLETKIVPYKNSLKEKIYLFGDIGANFGTKYSSLNLEVGVGLKNHEIALVIDSYNSKYIKYRYSIKWSPF